MWIIWIYEVEQSDANEQSMHVHKWAKLRTHDTFACKMTENEMFVDFQSCSLIPRQDIKLKQENGMKVTFAVVLWTKVSRVLKYILEAAESKCFTV